MIMKKYFALLMLLGAGLVSRAEVSVSPWDRNQEELKEEVLLPVKYPATFTRERELFGYDPRFMPAKVTFTPENIPVIRFGVQGEVGSNQMSYASRKYTPLNYIQFPGDDGRWRITDSHRIALRAFLKLGPNDDLTILSGERVPDMVEFDAAGNAYTLVFATAAGGKSGDFLLFSADRMKTWQVLELPRGIAMRIEPDMFHNSRKEPPVLLCKDGKGILLYAPRMNQQGALSLGEPVRIAEEPKAVIHMVMAGAGSPSLTLNDQTFVVYMLEEAREGRQGVPHYIVSYNRRTGEVSKPLFLEESGHRIDNHNAPVIAADSKGFIHVLLGTHWHSMVYLKSKNPADASGWERPEYVAGNGDNRWSRNGITYPGFVIDKEDTIHLVVRGRNSEFIKKDTADPANESNYSSVLDYALVYIRKKSGGVWEDRKNLVIPRHQNYSTWYHKISIDRQGRLFVSYLYYAHKLNNNEADEYYKKWPDECVGKRPTNDEVRSHDPVMIHSFDGGETWRITRTKDFLTQ
jgi:hypothetical protein